jgi:hypothetical protein
MSLHTLSSDNRYLVAITARDLGPLVVHVEQSLTGQVIILGDSG